MKHGEIGGCEMQAREQGASHGSKIQGGDCRFSSMCQARCEACLKTYIDTLFPSEKRSQSLRSSALIIEYLSHFAVLYSILTQSVLVADTATLQV